MSHRHESIMFMCALVIGAGFAAPAAAVPTERNLYVTDSENGLIYLVTPSKSVSVLVSEADITSATGASEARFTDNGMFFDLATEKLYFTDSESDSILVRDSTGAVSVIATEADIFAVTGHKTLMTRTQPTPCSPSTSRRAPLPCWHRLAPISTRS